MSKLYSNVIHWALASTLPAPHKNTIQESAINGQIITFGNKNIRTICNESFLTNDIVIYCRALDEPSKDLRLLKVVTDITVGLGEIKIYNHIKKLKNQSGTSSELPCLNYYCSKILNNEKIFICMEHCDIDLKTLFMYCEKQKIRLDLKNILLPIWLGIFKGLHFLHQHCIIYNNLKLECLVMTREKIKLINFEKSFRVIFVNSYATNAIFEEFKNLNNIIKVTLRMAGYTPDCLDKKIARLFNKCQRNKLTLNELIITTEKIIHN